MNILKKFCKILSTILVVIVVILAIALVGVRLIGLRPFAVLSGSMEPTYPTGSIVYVKKVDCNELKVGDPITFMLSDDTVATHRIVEIVPDPEDENVIRFRTKGDNNESSDSGLVHCENVVGKVVFDIPYLGYFSDFVQHKPGMYLAIAAAAVLLLLVFLPDLMDDDKKKDKNKEKDE